jgi:hypothetical protein
MNDATSDKGKEGAAFFAAAMVTFWSFVDPVIVNPDRYGTVLGVGVLVLGVICGCGMGELARVIVRHCTRR